MIKAIALIGAITLTLSSAAMLRGPAEDKQEETFESAAVTVAVPERDEDPVTVTQTEPKQVKESVAREPPLPCSARSPPSSFTEAS